MKSLQALGDTAYRWGYYLGMYSCLRAVTNLVSCRFRHLEPALKELQRITLTSPNLGAFTLGVHARPRPSAAATGKTYGVLSLQQQNPSIPGWAYRYLCATSHFACGHIEIAFYTDQSELTFYGIRNLASANARRLGFAQWAARLRLVPSAENELLLHAVSALLRERGWTTKHAAARDCLLYAVDHRLLPPGREAQMKNTLRLRYEKLSLAMNRDSA